jgi:hypothetical protein
LRKDWIIVIITRLKCDPFLFSNTLVSILYFQFCFTTTDVLLVFYLRFFYQNVYKPNRLETPFSRSNFIHKFFKIFCNLDDLHTCWFSDSCHNLLNHSKSLEFIKMNLTPCWLFFLINKHFLIAAVFDIWIIKNWMKHITSKITFMKITFFLFHFDRLHCER